MAFSYFVSCWLNSFFSVFLLVDRLYDYFLPDRSFAVSDLSFISENNYLCPGRYVNGEIKVSDKEHLLTPFTRTYNLLSNMKSSSLLAPALTPHHSLKTLVENRTVYNLEYCELNLFETYQASSLVPLKFNDLVVTSMLRGKKVMHLFDQEGFNYVPGESVIVPANVLMEIDFPEAELDNPTQCLALAIDHHKIAETLAFLNEKYPKEGDKNFWALDQENFFFQNNQEMNTLLQRVIGICQGTDIFKDTLADLALQELLVKIIQTQNATVAQQVASSKNPYLHHILQQIHLKIQDKVKINDLAREAGMSISSLYRLFKTELGMSPIEYIILEKIKLAKQHLRDKHIYVKNVAFEVGFDDSNYFNRLFKKYEGITPKQYQDISNRD